MLRPRLSPSILQCPARRGGPGSLWLRVARLGAHYPEIGNDFLEGATIRRFYGDNLLVDPSESIAPLAETTESPILPERAVKNTHSHLSKAVRETIFSWLRLAAVIFAGAGLWGIILGGISGCNGGSYTPPATNPVPAVSSLNPNSEFVSGAPLSLNVTGTGFISSSAVEWNGNARTTTFVSSTSLQAAITAADLAGAGTVSITVVNPGPGGGTSNVATFTINNPTPTSTSLSPDSALAGNAAFTLAVTGTGFVSSSTVQWNGNARPTTFVSSTSLQAALTAADVAAAGTANITVANPGPGGGTSSAATFTIDNPMPTATSLNPGSTLAGGGAFTLGVTGTGFVSSSTVEWNGSARTTTFVSSTSLQAAITAADIASTGTAMVTVLSPAPGGGTSGGLVFTIKPPPPLITLLNPSSAVAGGAAFALTVTGTNFVPASAVQWKGSARTTTFVSSTELHVAIAATDISSVGAVKVSVLNPPANGGTSSPSTFFVGSSGESNFAAITVNQAARDVVFDAVNGVFYLSVTGAASSNPNTIAVLNPSTGTVTSSVPAGINPGILALSDDSQFLYAGIDGAGAVQRFALPSLEKDISYSLGGIPNIALGLEVAPGAPHTTALAVGNPNVSPAAGGITIFDDANPRPTRAQTGLFSSIQWGADATTMFSANDESTGFDFYTLGVSSSGVVLNQDFSNRFSSFSNKIHFDSGTKLVYGDNGQVVDSEGVPAGVFDSSGVFNPSSAVIVPDSNLGTAFFVGQTASLGGVATFTIQSFDLEHFTPLTSVTVSGVTGNPLRLIRWGQNGLAFNTSGGQVFLIAGSFVSPAPPFTVTPPPAPTTPPTPAPNAPVIGSLTPSSAVAAGSGLTLNVNGTNFSTASMVQWNGSPRSTTFVSNTQLTATIPASDISTPGAASITVLNSSATGGVSAASTFFIGTTGGTSSGGSFAVTVLNQASKDMVFDPTHQVIYLSVPGTVAGGNTVSVLDPSSLKIVGTQFAGSDPDLLALSDDSQFLYAAIDGASSVQRFTLPSLGIDVKYPLGAHSFFGPYMALDLQVAPGAPHTSAVSLGNVGFSPRAQGGIVVFDDANARPTKAPGFGDGAGSGLFDSLQWGSNDTELFSANTDDSGFDFYKLSVTSTGVTLTQDFPGAGDGSRIHFDKGSNLVYCDGGRVINPLNGSNPAGFPGGMRMVPDSALDVAFFVNISATTATIQSFNLTTRAPISSVAISNVAGNPQRLIRWGQNGLAFNTDAGQIVLVGGNFVH